MVAWACPPLSEPCHPARETSAWLARESGENRDKRNFCLKGK